MFKMKYKGRTFTNSRSLADAMARDAKVELERKVRHAASATGVRIRKTHKGFEVEGDPDKMDRFNNRLGR